MVTITLDCLYVLNIKIIYFGSFGVENVPKEIENFIDKKEKDVLILSESPTQGFDSTKLTLENFIQLNLLKIIKKLCLKLHYNGKNSYLFVYGLKITRFNAIPLCLEKVSKDFSADNLKKTGSNGYVYDFSFGYDAVAFDDILDIVKDLMENNGIVKKFYISKANIFCCNDFF